MILPPMTGWKAIRQVCDYGLGRRTGKLKAQKRGLEEDKIRVEMKRKIRSEKRWSLTAPVGKQ